jgi:hypothetical protein
MVKFTPPPGNDACHTLSAEFECELNVIEVAAPLLNVNGPLGFDSAPVTSAVELPMALDAVNEPPANVKVASICVMSDVSYSQIGLQRRVGLDIEISKSDGSSAVSKFKCRIVQRPAPRICRAVHVDRIG